MCFLLPQKSLAISPPISAENVSQVRQNYQESQSSATLEQISTTVMYSFCDEKVPYRMKIPRQSPITLKEFKDYLHKKGNYR